MAISAASHPDGHVVTLWARDAAQVAQMQASRSNARYLEGIALPPSLAVASGDVAALADRSDLVIVATPMAGLRGMLVQLRPWPGCVKVLRLMPEMRVIRACWRTKCVRKWRLT